ncbi:hypothetical protein [Rhizorhabdus sp.]|uniref:DUF6874 family protein n=1 Tax=Rhizorhabdus sp. TaxID=1968843 RepID=UPI0035B125EF
MIAAGPSFDIDLADRQTAVVCVDRFDQLYAVHKGRGLTSRQKIELLMDLVATHASGCPLDFQKLHDFPDFSFMHDILGITQHLDRQTGRLLRFFRPRCARAVDHAFDSAPALIGGAR